MRNMEKKPQKFKRNARDHKTSYLLHFIHNDNRNVEIFLYAQDLAINCVEFFNLQSSQTLSNTFGF